MSNAYDKKARELVDKYDKGVDLNPGGRLAWLEKAIAQALRESTKDAGACRVREVIYNCIRNDLAGAVTHYWIMNQLKQALSDAPECPHAAQLSEFREHEKQTHERLGAILGTDDSLEECAKRLHAQLAEAKGEVERLRGELVVANDHSSQWCNLYLSTWNELLFFSAPGTEKQDSGPKLAVKLRQRLAAAEELIHAVGKLALESGETWRLAHPELMDAYEAITKPKE